MRSVGVIVSLCSFSDATLCCAEQADNAVKTEKQAYADIIIMTFTASSMVIKFQEIMSSIIQYYHLK